MADGEAPPTEVEDAGEARADDEPDPAAQSAALRRQQLYVGSGLAALAGIAAMIAGTQRYPDLPVYVFVLVGMATTALLFMLLYVAIFPGAEDSS
jgi:hypothetical protein